MEIIPVTNYIYVQRMPNHESVKRTLLEQFDKAQSEPIASTGEQIARSDWPWSSTPRNWETAFKRLLLPVLQELCISTKMDYVTIADMWFQQYTQTDYHGWHVHGGTNFSSAYMVECPVGMGTEFFDVYTGEIIKTVNIREGDIVTFPGQLYHRSPPNTSDSRKTIVSWNTNFASQTPDNVVRVLEQQEVADVAQDFNNGTDISWS